MNKKSALDRVRLEERSKILLKASQEVSQMLEQLAVSDKSKTKGKPDNQKQKPKANQNERSNLLTNLNAKKSGQPVAVSDKSKTKGKPDNQTKKPKANQNERSHLLTNLNAKKSGQPVAVSDKSKTKGKPENQTKKPKANQNERSHSLTNLKAKKSGQPVAVSDKSKTKGKPDNQTKKPKANQNERSHSLTNLKAKKSGQPVAVSDKSKTKGKPDNQTKKPKANQNERSHSLTNLKAKKSGQPVAVSDKSKTKGKPDNQTKKPKANQNERSHSLTILNAEKSSQPARGGCRGRGQRGRGNGQQPNQNRPVSGQCRPTRDFPPSYEEAVAGTRQFNPHEPSMFAPNMPVTQDVASNDKHQFHPSPSIIHHPSPLLPFAPEPSSKKRVEGSSKVPLVDVHLLIKELVSFSGFFTDVEKLSKLLDRNYDDVLKVIKDKSKIFSTLEDKSNKKVMVELCPAVKICEYHLGPSGCIKPCCFFIHICSDYVVGTCHKKNCPFGHSWKSNHNDFILRNVHIDQIPLHILHKLMEKVFSGTIVPKICYQYHQQNCEIGNQCNDLHICYSYVKTLGDCSSGASCPYNHNVRDPRCKAVLEKFGICMNESPRDLLKIISSRPNCFHKFEGNEDRGTSASKENEVGKELKEINEDNRGKKLQTEEDDQKENRKKRDEKPSEAKGTVCSWEFRGNVDTPLICYMNLFGKCAYFQKGCKYLHAKSTYHWQFGNDDKWYNFHKTHSEILESNFRDVTCDETILPKLDRDKVDDKMKELFSLLGNENIKVDFRRMTIDCKSSEKVYSIRHLTTASSAVCNNRYNTTFNWYFDAGNGKWELFGGSSDFSQSIEKVYQEDPTSIFNIATNNSEYKFDFSKMTQQNKKTMMMRKIRRRPAPFPAKGQLSVKKFELPQNWESMDDSAPYRLVKLDNESSEYKDIRQIIQLTFPMSNIIGISRVQNIQLWKQFKNKESEIERKYGDSCLNVQKLFHGIDDQFLADICRDNLDWRQFQEDIVRWYGNGAYFYNSAAEAAQRCRNYSEDSKNLLVAEVIIGKLAEGDGSMMRPPENPDLNTLFDTTTNSVTNPTVFVKYDKQEFYPAYIVEFS